LLYVHGRINYVNLDTSDSGRTEFFASLIAAMRGENPRQFISEMDAAGTLWLMLPEISHLKGVMQPPEYHPEGDAFVHSLIVLEKVTVRTQDPVARFAALYHDVGKGVTPRELWPRHIGHDTAGARLIETLDLRLPGRWISAARCAAALHMKAASVRKPGKITTLVAHAEGSGLGFRELALITECDDMTGGKPLPYDPEHVYRAFHSVTEADVPRNLVGDAAERWLHQERTRRIKADGS
jgi:tRNA nucleotidyltransferase (CCA-adding enzyme)